MSENLLSCEAVCAAAGDIQILDDINLKINKGETHVLMGPNGAGKSTLGHVIMGDDTYHITDGKLIFNGEDITDLNSCNRSQKGIFMSWQAPVEIPGVSLMSTLQTIAKKHGNTDTKAEFRSRILNIAEMLHLDESWLTRDFNVGFSGGEKKKVEMLQLLLLEPKLAILDETDSGLDVDALDIVSSGIQAYKKLCDGTLLIITHNTRILEHVDVDFTHVMVKGNLVATDGAELIEKIDTEGFEQFCTATGCECIHDCCKYATPCSQEA